MGVSEDPIKRAVAEANVQLNELHEVIARSRARIAEAQAKDGQIIPPETPPTHRGRILRLAHEATTQQRNRVYGEPFDNLTNTSNIFEAMTGLRLSPHEIALLMVANKLARLRNTPDHEDSAVDAAAYLAIALECLRGQAAADDQG